MCQYRKKLFWWPSMKKEIAEYVLSSLCQKVKIEHQKAAAMLKTLDIPNWKWLVLPYIS